MIEIVFSGYGGQGVLTAGLLIAQMAVFKGYCATWIPQYGSAMRGGTANCTVKFGREAIHNPSQEAPDILLAMNAPSLQRFLPMVKPGGTVILNIDFVDPALVNRDDVKLLAIPCVSMAKEIGHKLGANIIMAGAICYVSGEFSEQDAIDGMNDMFRKKGKEKFEEINTKALKLGFNYEKEAKAVSAAAALAASASAASAASAASTQASAQASASAQSA